MQVREGHASPLDERCFVHGLLDLGKVIGIMRMHGKSDAGARIAVYLEPTKEGTQATSMPLGARYPRAMAMALTAWLTAPAPID